MRQPKSERRRAIQQGRGAVHTVRQEIRGVLIFLGLIWAVFLLSLFLPSLDKWGLVPRHLVGLTGILTMTFLHENWQHLANNTLPLLILLTLLAGFKVSTWRIVIMIILVGGCLLWLFGMRGNHIGASLLIFGLITFLIASGIFFEKRPMSIAIAVLVAFLYGLTLLKGVIPRFSNPDHVSWDGHLCGAVAGVLVAYLLERDNQRRIARERILQRSGDG